MSVSLSVVGKFSDRDIKRAQTALDKLSRNGSNAAEELGGAFAKTSERIGKIGKAIAGAAATAAVAAGAIAGAAFVEGMDQEAGLDKAAARLALSEADAARLGEVAANAYTSNFGETVEANQAVVADVWKRFGDLGDEALSRVTEGALTLADVFESDHAEILKAAQQLYTNGLAPSAEAAMDMVAEALRSGKGPVDEQLAAIDEYANHFAQLGLDGGNIIAALSSDWATNQYAIDKVGDAVKELGIRAIDGSTATKEGLDAIGLSVDEVEAAYAAGGTEARKMSERIISSITAIEDPAERARAGVALMGTPFEDLGQNAVPILNDLIDGAGDFAGATQDIADQAYDNVQGRLAGAWRTLRQTFVSEVGGYVMPLATKLSEWLTKVIPPAIDWLKANVPTMLARARAAWEAAQPAIRTVVDLVSRVVQWFRDLSPEQRKLVADLALAAGAFVAAGVAVRKIISAFSAVSKAFKALSLLVSANPWVIIIAATVALVVLIVRNWDKILAALKKAWDWIKKTAGAVWEWLKNAFKKGLDFIVNLVLNWTLVGRIIKHWDAIKAAARGLWDTLKRWFRNALDFLVRLVLNWTFVGRIIKHWDDLKAGAVAVKDFVVEKFTALLDFFKELPGKVGSAISGLFDGLKDAFRSAINWVIGKWNDWSFSAGFNIPEIFGGGRVEIGFDTPNIPYLAQGGIARRPTLAGIGEAGSEAVIPLESARGRRALEHVGGPRVTIAEGAIQISIDAGGHSPADLERIAYRAVERALRDVTQELAAS